MNVTETEKVSEKLILTSTLRSGGAFPLSSGILFHLMGRIYLPCAWKDHLDTGLDSSISAAGIVNLSCFPFRNREAILHPYVLGRARLALVVEDFPFRDLESSLLLFDDELLPRPFRHQAKEFVSL